MDRTKRVRELLPFIAQIQDEKLRQGVVDVWVKVWEDSEWADLADCPVSPEVKDCSLIQHTNFVVTIAMAMASFAQDAWQVPVDKDILLAGALLHDACKMVEFAPREGKPAGISSVGENLVHGAYGVHLALNAGLPLRVANLIGMHTPRTYQKPMGVEGIFLCYADYAAVDIFYLRKGLPLLLSTLDFKFYR